MLFSEKYAYSPAYIGMGNVLIKADATDKNVVFIEASNEGEDIEGDTLLQKALEEEADSFLKRGVISFDHQHKVKNDPEYIIGEPLDVRFRAGDKDSPASSTLVKAKLYTAKNKHARTIKDLADEGSTRLGASVGGAILARKKVFDAKLRKARNYIVKVLWDEVAVTHKPINEFTLGAVSTIPFSEFKKSFMSDEVHRQELVKALTAGYGTNASAMSGGRVVIPESLMGAEGRKSGAAKHQRKLLKRNAKMFMHVVGNIMKSRQTYTLDLLKSELARMGYDEQDAYAILPSVNELIKNIISAVRSER